MLMTGIMFGNAVIKTTKGYVGVVPGATRAMDKIFVFEGSSVPVILRPSIQKAGFYQVVGACYVHGLTQEVILGLNRTPHEIFLV